MAPRPGFGVLDDGHLEDLKARAFDLLEDYGVAVIHPTAAAFKKAGVKPGRDRDRLRLPREIDALAAHADHHMIEAHKGEVTMI